MDGAFLVGIDVFPQLRDEVRALAVDVAGGVWVASDGNGLAYLAPGNWTPAYWSAHTTLPQNHLRGAVVDPEGDLWIGTRAAGLARYNAARERWTYYDHESGLASNAVNTIYTDQFAEGRRIFIATQGGINIYEGR
jgi:ligand-binding sensor domain-containing protein